MRFGEQLFALLDNDAAVDALVDSRIYPMVLPENVQMPAIAYQVISDIPENSLAGYTSQLRSARVQVDCYARSYDDANAVADAVFAVLGSYVTSGFKSSQVNRRDLTEVELNLNRVSMDFKLWSDDP